MAHQDQEHFLDSQCREAISLVPLYFTINSGQVYTQSDSPLRTILYHILDQLTRVNSHLQILTTPAAHSAIIDVLYKNDTLPLVNGVVTRVVELLSPKQKARLLVEGIAGCVNIAARLSQMGEEITQDSLRRELANFAASKQPAHIRHTVEHSHLFSDCLMTSQIMDLIMEASHDVDTSKPSICASFEDYDVDTFSNGYERPSRNMGLPWGFAFLVLN